MNIVKFQDIIMTPEVLMELPEGNVYKINEYYEWVENSPAYGRSPEEFCAFFNDFLRNKYAYALHWTSIIPMNDTITVTESNPYGTPIPVGNPFATPGTSEYTEMSYVNAENGRANLVEQWDFNSMIGWMDIVRTLSILQNSHVKYNYLNEFTPDDDITIEELKQFRAWLAGILLANTPMIETWNNPTMLTTMLTYYKQNMHDVTTDLLVDFSKYMTSSVLVAGTGMPKAINSINIGLSAGCGCYNGLQGVGNVAATSGCDPLQMYRNAIYNYMVETFSNIDYWTEQVEICVEMKKYIEGILKVGLPLGSNVIDPWADCGCSTFDSDSQTRYRRMLEALVQALTYIISGNISGNRNYISTAFSNWATYLYEYMYWA